jgi:hypothetical protein
MNQDILIQLLSDKNVYNNIIKTFPSLYSFCLIVKQNISKEAVEKATKKILSLYSEDENIKLYFNDLNNNLNRSETTDVTGMVMILDKKEDSFKKLMATAKKEKWQYKGIAIVDQFDSIRLYFY